MATNEITFEITKKHGNRYYLALTDGYTIYCNKVMDDNGLFTNLTDGNLQSSGIEPMPMNNVLFSVYNCNTTPKIRWTQVDDDQIAAVKPVILALVQRLALEENNAE